MEDAVAASSTNAPPTSLPVKAQVCGRPVGLLLGLSLTLNPFSAHASYKKIEHLPFAERLAAMRTPEMRAALLAEEPASDNPFVKAVLRNFAKMFPLADPPDYEPTPDMSLGAQAARTNKRAEELAYDWLLADDGRALILFPFLNYANDSLEPSLAMMRHPSTILGLGRRRRACRHDLRRQLPDLDAHALDARPHARGQNSRSNG